MTATENANFSDITTITEKEFKELKKKYEACEEGGIFKFKGKDVFKIYAKYLIEYLEGEFEKNKW